MEPDNVCYLDKMPAEVRQKIFGFVVKLDKEITPIQVKAKSNKFFWDEAQHLGRNGVNVAPQLDAVSLSRCSKTIYGEVATTHLFYQVNQYVIFHPLEYIVVMADVFIALISLIQIVSSNSLPQSPQTEQRQFSLFRSCTVNAEPALQGI